MRKLFAVAVSLIFFPAISFAQTLPATKPPGGLDSTTVIPKVYADGTAGTLAQIGQMADGSVQQTEKNAANGVSGLNANSEATAPVNTSGPITANGNQYLYGLSALTGPNVGGWGSSWLATHKITLGDATVISGGSASVSKNIDPDTFRVGGHRTLDSAYLHVQGLPYNTGENSGCIHSVVMSAFPDFGGDCGSGAWDAVADYVQAGNMPPWYEVGSEITDENGTTHTLSFSADGVTVSPALPASWDYLWRKNGMHIITNIVAGAAIPSDSGFIPPGSPFKSHPLPQYYAGVVDSYTTDTTTNTTKLHLGLGWHTFQEVNPTTVATAVPGASSTDSIDADVLTQFTKPVLLIGTYGKVFLGNQQCSIIRDPSSTDGTTKSRADSPANDCVSQEYDLIYSGPDYGATMQGPSVSYMGPNLPAANSYGFAVNGNLPEGFRSWLGPDGLDFDGDAFVMGSRRGPADTVGTDKEMFESLQAEAARSDADSTYRRVAVWQHVDTAGADGNANSHTFRDNSIHFGPVYGGHKGLIDGTLESQLIFNPAWEKWGVALCGPGHVTTTNTACFTMDSGGSIYTAGSITAGTDVYASAGHWVGALSASGQKVAFEADSDTSLELVSSTGSPTNLGVGNNITAGGKFSGAGSDTSWLSVDTVTSHTTDGVISVNSPAKFTDIRIPFGTPASSTSDCTQGQIEMDADYIYSCVATNTWHRASNGATW
ncbi:hypothetical protein AD948_04450 [Acetobacter senegalensis]|uniref:Uncharacterized protein n=1 Tax=Acetobacter senegalensis TaxID=446692 RepID=A0A149U5Z3_9PROT|nr:hypothetical protein [Acetobacter senegalensis]KXV60679.1 hypothetical protein AD948_04450 [Acetobacter senegalensis]